ncbi:ribosome silencing factor [Helicobacter enhydrae]|uniref:Ribosomal silencing factor RsfS n=1 Tax=Helicobacter enhydrae TaxID=222136 RepID=A0A1B1U590_9HELI|nr:ribosome silencing factor [Helicobacter enhydrae]ANV97964.1 ribosome silencing factor [Helicobacter enhydrae]
MTDLQTRVQRITQILDDKKAENIEVISLEGKEYITDVVVIATALVGKHSFALLDTLKTQLKPLGETFYGTEEESEDWIIADLGEIMIHIFTEEHRKKFNLEEFLNSLIHSTPNTH